MADPIFLVRGDTGPDIQITLTRQDTGNPVDLTGATVTMDFTKRYESDVLFSVDGQGTPQERQQGIVVLVFSDDQLDQPTGYYSGEFQVTYADGQKETVYEPLDFFIRNGAS